MRVAPLPEEVCREMLAAEVEGASLDEVATFSGERNPRKCLGLGNLWEVPVSCVPQSFRVSICWEWFAHAGVRALGPKPTT